MSGWDYPEPEFVRGNINVSFVEEKFGNFFDDCGGVFLGRFAQRLLGVAVGDEFDRPEQTEAAHVADA